MFKLFDSVVKHMLCYGAKIWGHEYKSRIEQVHAKSCRKYYNLTNKTNSVFALGECGRVCQFVYLVWIDAVQRILGKTK